MKNGCWILVLTLLLFFATLRIQCADDSIDEVKTLSVVSTPRSGRYTTVVALDGGGLRGIISTMVLIEFENAIKRHMIEKNPEVFPEGLSAKRPDDFEIDLADYVDCFSGVSSGGWAALYLASKGKNSPISKIFHSHKIIVQYGTISPGSSKALLLLYLEYGKIVFPQSVALPGNGMPQDDDPLGRGVLKPIYSPKGMEKTLSSFFGEITMADLETSCVIPTFDLLSRTMTLFAHNHFVSPPRAEVAELRYRLSGNSSTPEQYLSHTNVRTDVNFYACDIAKASGATPILLPAIELTQVDETAIDYIAVDGTMGGSSPALQALIYVANERGLSSFESMAVLSIGNGLAYDDYEDNANGGLAQWSTSGEMFHLYANFMGDMINSQLDYMFNSSPKAKQEQYLRIQKFEPLNTVDGFLLSLQDRALYLRELQSIGEAMAEDYRKPLDAFVRDFVFLVTTQPVS